MSTDFPARPPIAIRRVCGDYADCPISRTRLRLTLGHDFTGRCAAVSRLLVRSGVRHEGDAQRTRRLDGRRGPISGVCNAVIEEDLDEENASSGSHCSGRPSLTLVAGCSSVGSSSSSSSDRGRPHHSRVRRRAQRPVRARVAVRPPTPSTSAWSRRPAGSTASVPSANSVYTAYVDNLTQSNFVDRSSPTSTLKPNTEFGTYEKTSDDPLTVNYTFNDKAVWSDGVPIDCDDAMLLWAAAVGQLPDRRRRTTPATTSTSSPRPRPTGSPKSRSRPASPATSPSPSSTTTPYADWEATAHRVADHAGPHRGRTGRDELCRQRSRADRRPSTTDNVAALTPVANFWNTGWNYQPDLPTIPAVKLLPSLRAVQVSTTAATEP